MNNTLNSLGIDKNTIEAVVDMCEDCLNMFEINRDGWEDNFIEHLEDCGRWDNITESIIGAYLETTAAFIQDKYPELAVNIEPCDALSTIYINGETYTSASVKGDFVKDFDLEFTNNRTDDYTLISYNDLLTVDSKIQEFVSSAPDIVGIFKENGVEGVKVTESWKQFMGAMKEARDEIDLSDAFAEFTYYETAPDTPDNRAAMAIIKENGNKEYVSIDELLEGMTEHGRAVIGDGKAFDTYLNNVMYKRLDGVSKEQKKSRPEIER